MKLLHYYLDFEHFPETRQSRAFLYDSPDSDPVDWVEVAAHVDDTFSRRGGRRACLAKLLSAHQGKFAGVENKKYRQQLWKAYWEAMPQDKYPHVH